MTAEELIFRDPILAKSIEDTWNILGGLARSGKNQWLLAYSGGKDSTLAVVLTVEFLRRTHNQHIEVDILYADTRLEIPPIYDNSMRFLCYLQELSAEEDLPIKAHIVSSELSQSFWVHLLGKGYPMPGPRFRWCTDRLKVKPMNRKANELVKDEKRAVMLIAVRNGESRARDRRLKASCGGQSECGQGLQLKSSSFVAVYPILEWRTCKIWDLLLFHAPMWGWPTGSLGRLYGEDERVRFGCWLCSLVKEDRAMANIIRISEGDGFMLGALAAFRELLVTTSRDVANRITRPDGRAGRLNLTTRKRLLSELLGLQEKVSTILISAEEIRMIQDYWNQNHEAREVLYAKSGKN